VPQHLSQDKPHLDVRQIAADAVPRPETEGLQNAAVVISERRICFVRQETLGAELLGSMEVGGGMVRGVLLDADDGLVEVMSVVVGK